jgi:hypothetical protein
MTIVRVVKQAVPSCGRATRDDVDHPAEARDALVRPVAAPRTEHAGPPHAARRLTALTTMRGAYERKVAHSS